MNLHLAANLALSAFHAAVALAIIFQMLRRPVSRNFLSVSVVLALGVLAAAFALHGLLVKAWYPALELAGLTVASLPGIFFLLQFRGLTGDTIQTPAARFNQMKDEFLSVASHELRTPLSVINGFAEILVREKLGPLNDEQKRRVRKILMQGQRLNRIVDELLDLSRIRSGKVEIRRAVFDMVPVLKACLDDHQIVCDQQKIKLVDSIPDVLPDVLGDIERVTQIVVNLLNNAIKYTEPGGNVTLSACFNKARNEVLIEVRDTGIGIDATDQPRIFEEFYRANHELARKYKGSGLGLAIVKQLVETQGGRVGLQSEGIGKGTCFFFTLPAAGEAKTAAKTVAHAKG